MKNENLTRNEKILFGIMVILIFLIVMIEKVVS